MHPSTKIPKLSHHKPSGRDYVRIGSRCIYLGAHGHPETDRAYRQFIAEWLATGVREARRLNTLMDLVQEYDAYALQRFGHTSHLVNIKLALEGLLDLYGDLAIDDFGPRRFKAMQFHWAQDGKSRRTVNYRAGVVKRMIRWGVANELVDPKIDHALATVPGLRRGEHGVHDPPPVTPVPMAHIQAVRPLVSRQVRALIDLQLLTGARPGELFGLRPMDFDMKDAIWTSNPPHKNEWRDQDRTLYFGPQAKEVVRAFLDRPTDALLFSPQEAEKERHASKKTHRRPDQKLPAPKTKRQIGERYDKDSYRRAIARACKKAGVPHWSPHRLRHTAATEIRRRFGLEAAQAMLGHKSLDATQIYAEVHRELALKVAESRG